MYIICLGTSSTHFFQFLQAVVQKCSVKTQVLLKNSPNAQQNNYVKVSFLIKLQASGQQLYLKRDSGTGLFL